MTLVVTGSLLVGAGIARGFGGRSLARVNSEAEAQRQELVAALTDAQHDHQGVTQQRDTAWEKIETLQTAVQDGEAQRQRASAMAVQRLQAQEDRIQRLESERDQMQEQLLERDEELTARDEREQKLQDQFQHQSCELAESREKNQELLRELAAAEAERDRRALQAQNSSSPVSPPKRRWKIPTFFDP